MGEDLCPTVAGSRCPGTQGVSPQGPDGGNHNARKNQTYGADRQPHRVPPTHRFSRIMSFSFSIVWSHHRFTRWRPRPPARWGASLLDQVHLRSQPFSRFAPLRPADLANSSFTAQNQLRRYSARKSDLYAIRRGTGGREFSPELPFFFAPGRTSRGSLASAKRAKFAGGLAYQPAASVPRGPGSPLLEVGPDLPVREAMENAQFGDSRMGLAKPGQENRPVSLQISEDRSLQGVPVPGLQPRQVHVLPTGLAALSRSHCAGTAARRRPWGRFPPNWGNSGRPRST